MWTGHTQFKLKPQPCSLWGNTSAYAGKVSLPPWPSPMEQTGRSQGPVVLGLSSTPLISSDLF